MSSCAPQTPSSFLATDEFDGLSSPLHPVLSDESSCSGANTLDFVLKDDGPDSKCSVDWADEEICSELSLGPGPGPTALQCPEDTSDGESVSRNQDSDFLFSEEGQEVSGYYNSNAQRVGFYDKVIHFTGGASCERCGLWQPPESVFTFNDLLPSSDPPSVLSDFSLSTPGVLLEERNSAFADEDWRVGQGSDDSWLFPRDIDQKYSRTGDDTQDKCVGDGDVEMLPNLPRRSHRLLDVIQHECDQVDGIICSGLRDLRPMPSGYEDHNQEQTHSQGSFDCGTLRSETNLPLNTKYKQESHSPEHTSHGSPAPKTRQSFMLTEPRSRLWTLEKLEELASRLLGDLSCRRIPTVALSARAQMQSTVYDQRDGVIRRKPNPFVCGDCSKRYYQRLPQAVTLNIMKRKLEETGLYNYKEIKRWAQSSSVSSMHQSAPLCIDAIGRVGVSSKQNHPQIMNPIDHGVQGVGRDIGCNHEGGVSVYTPGPYMRISRLSKPGGWHSIRAVVRIADLIHEGLSQSIWSTKRDLYYRDPTTFRGQNTVDRLVEDIACTLQVPRSTLNVTAGARGLMFGSIRLLIRRPHRPQDSTRIVEEERGSKSPEQAEDPVWLQNDIEQMQKQQQGANDLTEIHDDTIFHDIQERQRTTDHGLEKWEDECNASGAFSSSVNDSILTEYNTLVTLPANMDDVLRIELHPRTKTILVVEKEATMNHLISIGFYESPIGGPCVLLTGKGYPDIATRSLLKRLQDMVQAGIYTFDIPSVSLSKISQPRPTFRSLKSVPLSIPVLAFVDCDPHGIEIFLTYKCGSIQSAYDNANLAIPTIRCVGQVPSDWEHFLKRDYPDTRRNCSPILQQSSGSNEARRGRQRKQSWRLMDSYLHEQFQQAMLPLSQRERAKLVKLLMVHPFVKSSPEWRRQISKMLMLNRKTELQSLCIDIQGGDTQCDLYREQGMMSAVSSSKGNDRSASNGTVNHALMYYLERKLLDPHSWM